MSHDCAVSGAGRSRVLEGSMHCPLYLLLPATRRWHMHAVAVSSQLHLQHTLVAACRVVTHACCIAVRRWCSTESAALPVSTKHAHRLHLEHVQPQATCLASRCANWRALCCARCFACPSVLSQRRGAGNISCRALQRARHKALSMSSARAWRQQLSRATRGALCKGALTFHAYNV